MSQLATRPQRREQSLLSIDDVRTLVGHALLAPSGANSQPWKFRYRDGVLSCTYVPELCTSFLDYAGFASFMSIGAVAENISLAAQQLGFEAHLSAFPDASEPRRVLDVRFEPLDRPPRDAALFEQIPKRRTNRKLGTRVPLAHGDAARLKAAAADRGGRLQILESPRDLHAVAGDVLGPCDRIRFGSKIMHPQFLSEIRWTAAEIERTRDGMDVATLEMTRFDKFGLRAMSALHIAGLVNKVCGRLAFERSSRDAIRCASAVGLLTIPGGNTPTAMYEGGRALQRMWLEATALGYAFQPMTSLVCLSWRLLDGGEGLRPAEKKKLVALRKHYRRLFELRDGEGEVMLFRLSRAHEPSAPALRRRVEDMLVLE